jgi:hypothetical protein
MMMAHSPAYIHCSSVVTYRQALRHKLPSSQRASRNLSLGLKQLEREADHLRL